MEYLLQKWKQLNNKKMLFLKKLKKMIYSSDMFCSSEMLRYDSQTQYKTLTGGLLSISITVFILIAFASMISDTINRLTISSSLQVVKQSDPALSVLRTDEQHMFMFGISIRTPDLTQTLDFTQKRYFNTMMTLSSTLNGVSPKQVFVPLERCTLDHWKMLPDVSQRFDALQASRWLCPPLNYDFPLQGAFSSPLHSGLVIHVTACKNNSFFAQPCAPQTQIDALTDKYTNFFLNMNYVNPIISPSQPDHISYYLQASDYLIFSKVVGANAYIEVSEYTIDTDDSIWPLTNNVVEKGIIVEQKSMTRSFSFSAATPYYAAIFIVKSINSLIYTREVQKISAVLSYIGGLVGAITAFLFLIKAYTDSSLEISIGISLFNDSDEFDSQHTKKDNSIQPSFNFFRYIGLVFYQVLKEFGWQKKWDSIDKIQDFQREAIQQLDIKVLMRRIIHLELWMTYLFDQDQLEGLKYQKPISCTKAKQMRQIFMSQRQNKVELFQKQSLDKINKQAAEDRMQTGEDFIHKAIKEEICHSQNQAQFAPERKESGIQSNLNNINIALKKQVSIPVQYIEKRSEESGLNIFINKLGCLDELSLRNLLQLNRKAKEDKRSDKIWSNIRSDIKDQIVSSKCEAKRSILVTNL